MITGLYKSKFAFQISFMSNLINNSPDSTSDSDLSDDFSEDSLSSFARLKSENLKIIKISTNSQFNVHPMIGKQFSSFNQKKSFVSEIKAETGFNSIIQRSETISPKLKKIKNNRSEPNHRTNEKIKILHYQILLRIRRGEPNNSNILSTKKLGCPAYVKFLLKIPI